jgi:hypothetical protein
MSSGINVVLKQDLQFARTKFVKEANPIYIKNLQPPSQAVPLSHLSDVRMDNPINNSVLIYNQGDENFHLDQLSLDGGAF